VANLLRSVLYLILMAFCLLPALPLTLSWIDTARRKTKFDIIHTTFLILVSASFACILLALISPIMLPSPYSSARGLMIRLNTLLMVLVAIVEFIRNRDITSTVLAASATALVWFYIAIINVPV
jgi:hypothetical protein